MNEQTLFAKAESLGIKFKKNIKENELLLLIEEAELAPKVNKTEVKKTEAKKTVTPSAVNIIKPIKKQKNNTIKTAKRMVRCIITPLSESMRTMSSEMYAVGNGTVGFIKKVVRFNKETIEPCQIVRHLNSKKMLLQIETGEGVNVKLERVPAFNIKILPDYTEKELNALFEKGKAAR
ncbi:MAG: hypothetical protein L3I99_01945 [Sulfurimonas sp.]|nr:hypothetical protein [Sulfurimonas sp.]